MLSKKVVDTVMKKFRELSAEDQVEWVEYENNVFGHIHPMSEFNAYVCDLYKNVKGNGIINFLNDCIVIGGHFKADDPWFCYYEDEYELDSGKSPCEFVIDENELVEIILCHKEKGLRKIGFSNEEAEALLKEVEDGGRGFIFFCRREEGRTKTKKKVCRKERTSTSNRKEDSWRSLAV